MGKNYWNAEQLNKQVSKIIEEGYNPPTQLYRIQQRFARVVINNSLRNPGYIRTYSETNEFLLKQYGERAHLLSEKEYNSILKELQDSLGKERSFQGVVREQRRALLDIVEDMNEFLDTDVKVNRLTTKQLYDAVKAAGIAAKNDSKGSPSFYEYLADILSEI